MAITELNKSIFLPLGNVGGVGAGKGGRKAVGLVAACRRMTALTVSIFRAFSIQPVIFGFGTDPRGSDLTIKVCTSLIFKLCTSDSSACSISLSQSEPKVTKKAVSLALLLFFDSFLATAVAATAAFSSSFSFRNEMK